jgi:hypothetical protein
LTTQKRLDPERLTFHLVPMPKRAEGTRGAGFAGDEPAGTFAGTKKRVYLVTPSRTIELGAATADAPVGPGPIYPGVAHTGPRGAARPVAWTLGGEIAAGRELDRGGFDQAHAIGADGTTIVGTGEPKGTLPSRGLLWRGAAPPIQLANPNDPSLPTSLMAVCGDVQGGKSGGPGAGACVFRGTTDSYVNLHPSGTFTSGVRGLSEDQIVGDVTPSIERSAMLRAAIFVDTGRFVDLTPDGVPVAVATGCAAGFQAGWGKPSLRAPITHAWLWAGSAATAMDLHPSVGPEWTASSVHYVRALADRVVLVGSVDRRDPDRPLVVQKQQACYWEYRF